MLLLSLLIDTLTRSLVVAFTNLCAQVARQMKCETTELKREYTKKKKQKKQNCGKLSTLHKTQNDNTQSGCGKLMKEFTKNRNNI